jgi:signal transduction histidine kinase
MFFDFLENLALLTLIGIGVFLIERAPARQGGFSKQALYGIVFGVVAFLVSATPLTLVDGATLDSRAGPVVLAGVVGGPISALLAAILGALSRGMVGGSFAISGMIVYFVYGLIGVALTELRIVRPETVIRARSIFVVAFGSICGAAAMFFLIEPMERAVDWLTSDLPLIMATNFISVTYTAAVVGSAALLARNTAEIHELNETLELAKRAGGFGIWDYDIRSDNLHWDKRSAELHGIHPDDLDGNYADWARNVHEDDLAATEKAFREALSGSKEFSAEYRVSLPENGERAIKGNAIVLRDASGDPVRVVGTNLDLTELRTAEAKLNEARSIALQAQKFETIGKLTGGVAHDFNNLLAVILGNQELLQDALDEDNIDRTKILNLIDASIKETNRGAELTQSLLAYSRQASLTPELVDINSIVLETVSWMRRTIESQVEIECVLQDGLRPTLVDSASMQSAIINLLVNARDALEPPGEIIIKTANVRIDQNELQENERSISPGCYVKLAIRDTGAGIPAELVGKIFDPFFTTKPLGEGTGLGLSMVQGFVTQSGGKIAVESEPGVGTTFTLYFPAATDAQNLDVDHEPEEIATSAREQRGSRILVVEDREDLLSILENTLLEAGYEVKTASNGDEALEIFKSDPRFDLIATDVVMPGVLQGPSFAKEVRAIQKSMHFIFFSGYAQESLSRGNGLAPGDIILMKPVSRQGLFNAIEKALAIPSTDDA